MALRIHSLEMASHVSPGTAQAQIRTAPAAATSTTAAASPTTQAQTSAPGFSAVFAQIAAAAAAAGTTVASVAPAGGGTSAPAVSIPPATTPPTSSAAASDTTVSSVAPSGAAASPASTSSTNDPAGPLFGPDPWIADPTGGGPNDTVTHYNPVYFATQQTAQTVAQALGGTVVQSDQITTAPGSPFQQDDANYMVQLPGGGMVNPGFIADIYTHGWNQAFINQQVASEVAGAEAAVNT